MGKPSYELSWKVKLVKALMNNRRLWSPASRAGKDEVGSFVAMEYGIVGSKHDTINVYIYIGSSKAPILCLSINCFVDSSKLSIYRKFQSIGISKVPKYRYIESSIYRHIGNIQITPAALVFIPYFAHHAGGDKVGPFREREGHHGQQADAQRVGRRDEGVEAPTRV